MRLLTVVFALACLSVRSQVTRPIISFADFDRFWTVYDRVASITDSAQAVAYIQQAYLDKGSDGLKGLIQFNAFGADEVYDMVRAHRTYLDDVRKRGAYVRATPALYTELFRQFKRIYPAYRQPDVYFVVGNMTTGGTGRPGRLLIGMELAPGTKASPSATLHPYHQAFLRNNTGIGWLMAHELVHTQQVWALGQNLDMIGFCIKEGAADFVSEFVLLKPISRPYLTYGRAHADSLRTAFMRDKFLDDDTTYYNWLYNGLQRGEQADLGYYIGYEICKAYYRQAPNKQKALADIIALDLNDKKAVHRFYEQSRYETTLLDHPSKMAKAKLARNGKRR